MLPHRLKKLWCQATRRGTQENDILLNRFMRQVGSRLSEKESITLEALLQEADQDIYHWIMNMHDCPECYQDLIQEIRRANALI